VFRRSTLIALILCAASSVSCVTTYDSYGRPVQTVDPGMAVAGMAAAGLIGYAIADNHNHHHSYYGYGGGYCAPRPHYYGGGGYYRGGYGGGYSRGRYSHP
jgi:hypothetical protein